MTLTVHSKCEEHCSKNRNYITMFQEVKLNIESRMWSVGSSYFGKNFKIKILKDLKKKTNSSYQIIHPYQLYQSDKSD